VKPRADVPASMSLTLAIWICALPVVLLLVGPAFGLKAAAVAAGGLLVALAAICWSACARDRAPSR